MYSLQRLLVTDLPQYKHSVRWAAVIEAGMRVSTVPPELVMTSVTRMLYNPNVVAYGGYRDETLVAVYVYGRVFDVMLQETIVTNILEVVSCPGVGAISLGRKVVSELQRHFPWHTLVLASTNTPYEKFSRYAKLLGLEPQGTFFTKQLGAPYG